MNYGVIVRDKQGHPEWFYDGILPGFIPDTVLDMMVADFVDETLNLCRLCDAEGRRCHVIDFTNGGRKLCPILFHDALKPKAWRVENLA